MNRKSHKIVNDSQVRKQNRGELQRPYKWKILIVDDDITSQKMLAGMLPDEKYEKIQAKNGKEALEVAFRELPDLVLLDILMPHMDGFEVTRRVKKDSRTKNIPIILITAMDETEYKAIGLEAGAEELLNKPIQPTELLARVNSMLRLKQFRDQLTIRSQSEQLYGDPAKRREKPFKPVGETPHILLVEDNDVDAKVVENSIEGLPIELKTVKTGKTALSAVKEDKVDLVLLDILLPDVDGFEICRRLKENEEYKEIQIVIITCLGDLESKIKGVELGADDFIVKPIVRRELRARIKTLLEKKGHLDRLRSHYEAALDSAILDWLTGLYNHGYFKEFMNINLKKSLDQGYPVSLIMLDVDDFKQYNDILGHSAGDAILRELGQIVRNIIREVDLAARYGGEEFAIVLPYANGEASTKVAERIQHTINSHKFFDDGSDKLDHLTVSMGIAVFPENANNLEELIEKADKMLYKAKKSGKNQFWLYDQEEEIHQDKDAAIK